MTMDPQAAMMMVQHLLKPWHESLANPAVSQERVLDQLVRDYAKTRYGSRHGRFHKKRFHNAQFFFQ